MEITDLGIVADVTPPDGVELPPIVIPLIKLGLLVLYLPSFLGQL